MSRSILLFLEDIGGISAISGPSLGISNSMTSQAMPIASTDGTPDLNIVPPPLPKKKKQIIPSVDTYLPQQKYNKHHKKHHG